MNQKLTPDETGSNEIGKVSCDICRKEVPLSAAIIPEAVDYVAHFCGLECYTQWKQHAQRSQKAPSGKSGR
ncbi:MAG: DUF3330 domain-containing protein [Nitrosomonadales bacterium]|nr:DUF3330 domain-containing protein [Nitrosomonadales bacterium]